MENSIQPSGHTSRYLEFLALYICSAGLQCNLHAYILLQSLTFQKLWDLDSQNPTRLVPKWTKHHIDLTRGKKMKVCLAAQIFSHSASAALRTYIHFGLIPQDAEGTAVFLQVSYIWCSVIYQ